MKFNLRSVRAVDRRTDIWAFGCVLYEMLTGKPPFTGETITDTLAAVVRAEPEWELLPSIPISRSCTMTCLPVAPGLQSARGANSHSGAREPQR